MPVITARTAPTFAADGRHDHRARRRRAAARRRRRLARPTLQPGHASPPHALTHEEVFVVLAARLTARYDDREETAEAGGALIVRPGDRFELIARDAPVEAVCVMAAGGQAITDEATFTPPWAE